MAPGAQAQTPAPTGTATTATTAAADVHAAALGAAILGEPEASHMRHGALSRQEAESERDRDRGQGRDRDGMEWRSRGSSRPGSAGAGPRPGRETSLQGAGASLRRAREDPATPREEESASARGRAGAAEPEPPGARRREHRRQQEAGAAGSGSRESDPRPGGHRRAGEEPLRERPSLELSGALLEDANAFRGVVVRYSEPPEARVPKQRWRLYPFKSEEALPVMHVHRQSAYLLGRHRRVADIPIDHPSCSKQHAVFQYRLAECPRADGTVGRRVKPYIIDLASGNGTFLNNQRIEPHRYYELKEKDVLKFGFSSREYVLLHEFSHTSEVGRREDEEEEGVSDS
ncbi:smad nuclear-interacting protein 1-like [Sorex fumeus]|uniref:smad nuclear-interacting protein 1-like n=1 Tax=Sorex fumeus TaxID=62283 RepID=UPI0024ACA913|nr:smad nuclear-interacting protein 1-like [Sorex fumeus]